MSDSNTDGWLTNYYNRIQGECALSIERRDKIMRLCYIVLAAGIATYAGFFADGSFITPLGRFALISGILMVLIRFFFQSMIAYNYFLRWRYLRNRLEQYWMKKDDCPSLKEIKDDISTYDHGKTMPNTGRSLIMGQAKSGFVLVLAPVVFLLVLELWLEQSWNYACILVGLVGYVIWEVYTFRGYDQMQHAKA